MTSPAPKRAEPDARLDIVRDACPMTWVKAKLELEDLPPGAALEVRVRDGESRRNVSANAVAEGHALLSDEPDPAAAPAGSIRLLLFRKAR